MARIQIAPKIMGVVVGGVATVADLTQQSVQANAVTVEPWHEWIGPGAKAFLAALGLGAEFVLDQRTVDQLGIDGAADGGLALAINGLGTKIGGKIMKIETRAVKVAARRGAGANRGAFALMPERLALPSGQSAVAPAQEMARVAIPGAGANDLGDLGFRRSGF